MNIKKRQWITVLALSLTFVLVVACGVKGTPAPTKAPVATKVPPATEAPARTKAPAVAETPTEAAAPTEAPAAPAGEAKSIIAKSAAGLKGLKSYRARIIVETAGQKMEMLYEFVSPDKFHMVSDFAEMIGIGEDMYMKVGETWTKVPAGGAEAAMAGISGAKAAVAGVTEEAILEVQPGGTEDVEGIPCQKYVYTARLGDNPPVEFTAWIGLKDGLPHKMVTEMADTTTTQILYDFNADITIEPPEGAAEGLPGAPQPTVPLAGLPQPPAGEGTYDTVFPLPDDVQNFMGEGGESQVNFQTSLSLEEVIEFYRQALTDKGLTERTILTAITDTTFSMVFDGWPNGKALVIQGVDLGPNRNVNIRFEDV